MEKRKMNFSKIMLIVMLCLLSVLASTSFIFEAQRSSGTEAANHRSGYHIQIVTEKDRDYFWNDFKEGAKQAADEKGITVEFVESNTRTTEDIISLVERGIYANVDGIAFRPTDIIECSEAVEMAKDRGISIITFESEENMLPMTGSVNSDYFQIGKEQGKLLVEASGGEGDVVVIANEKDMQDGESLCNAEKMRGIIENFTGDVEMEVLDYYKVNPEMFQTEQVIMQVFEEHPQVKNIICTDASITQGVAEYIKENGKTGQVNLIGYGNTQTTLEDIKDGVIYGTVYADAKSIGYGVIQKLCDILDGEGKEDIESVEAKVIKGEES